MEQNQISLENLCISSLLNFLSNEVSDISIFGLIHNKNNNKNN